jgi:hypothetical protein
MNWAQFINEILAIIKRQRKGCSAIPAGELDMQPKQRDKPSPSSHWELMELYKLLKRRWSYSKGYGLTLVANTNSMEPIIDDHSVVVYEDFRGKEEGHLMRKRWPIRKGDICIYRVDPAKWSGFDRILHQVTQVRKNGEFGYEYKFRGVNNFFNDPEWVSEARILGRAFLFANAKQEREND